MTGGIERLGRIKHEDKKRKLGNNMRHNQQAAGKQAAGNCICREIECGEVFLDQRIDEPEVLFPNFGTAGKDPDDKFL